LRRQRSTQARASGQDPRAAVEATVRSVKHPFGRDSAAIARPGNRLSVEKREGRYKKDKRCGLSSFTGEFWGLRCAANLGRERSKSIGADQVRQGEQESGAHQSKSGNDRRIKQARLGRHACQCLAQAGGSDPARGRVCAGAG
jgi:hypothetical protein